MIRSGRNTSDVGRRKVTGAKRTVSTWLRLLISATALLSIALPAAESDRDGVLFCGACIALVEELNWLTGITSSKLKLQIGSFNLDAKGNTGAKEIPLKSSETYLTEIYETVCRYTYYYAKSIGPGGRTNYIMTQSRDGQKIASDYADVSSEIKNELRFACDWVLEEYDDWMVPYYKAMDTEVAKKLCVEKSGLCQEQNLTDQMWAYASAVMAGQVERGVADLPPERPRKGDDDDDDHYYGEEEIFADETDEWADHGYEL